MTREFLGNRPQIHGSAFVAPGAEIIGSVTVGKDASIWYNAVLRGDLAPITIGERSNVQDGCLLHVRNGRSLRIDSDTTLGHGVIAHACTIGDHVLLGMGSVILDEAVIRPYTIVAAGSVVRIGSEFPEGVMVAGVPAKIVREVSAEERVMIEDSSRNYVEYFRQHRVTVERAE